MLHAAPTGLAIMWVRLVGLPLKAELSCTVIVCYLCHRVCTQSLKTVVFKFEWFAGLLALLIARGAVA